MRTRSRTVGLAGAVLALTISLSGCAANGVVDLSNDTPGMDHGQHTMSIFDKQSFALAMIPHHEQAITMSELAKANTTNPKVLEIAEQISSEQSAEIEKMTPWLEGEAVDYNMLMEGMITDSLLEDLANAKGAEFDKLYVELMIIHHDGAISMATVGAETSDSELVELSKEIIRVQTLEIESLREISN